MFRFLIDAETVKQRKKVITATAFYMIFGTIAFTVIAGIVMAIIKYQYGALFIAFVISNVLLNLSNCLSRGEGKIKLYSLSNFILGASTIILNIIFNSINLNVFVWEGYIWNMSIYIQLL